MKTTAIYAVIIGVHLLVLLFLLIPRGGPPDHENGIDERAVANIPPPAAEEGIVEEPEQPPEPAHETYRVQRGDNLTIIARRHRTTVSELKALNNLTSDLIVPDQELIVPTSEDSENNGVN